MTQFLHIFKKDVRRHWPEILISLALLGFYTSLELHLWEISHQYPRDLFRLAGTSPFFLTLSWIFLIFHVVQGETLVGDRQWWVTKPYVWWQLLLSKLFFVFVFISAPLFNVQLLVLRRAGFAALPNLVGLFLMQLTLPQVLLVCAFALASLTKNLAQALLGLGIIPVVFIVGDRLFLSRDLVGDSYPLINRLEVLLIFGSLVFVTVWQFARRETWLSRITLAACIGAAMLLCLIPFGRFIEQSYPLLAAEDSPAKFTISSIPESHDDSSDTSDRILSIPVNATGIAPGSVVLIEGMKMTADSSDGSHWTPGWVRQFGRLWPGLLVLDYRVKRKDYERVKAKPLSLHLQLALCQYKAADERTLVIPSTTFRDNVLGICRLGPDFGEPWVARMPIVQSYRFLKCRKPFHSPSYIGRFDVPGSKCDPATPTYIDVAYAWAEPNEGIFPDPGLNPIVEHSLGFYSPPDPAAPRSYNAIALCPGAEIHIGRPIFKRQFRIQLELPHVLLE